MPAGASPAAPPPAARAVLRSATSTERTGFAPFLALRPALGVALGLTIGIATGHPTVAATLGAGALTVGVASLVGRFRAPLLMLAVTCVAMGLAAFTGSVSAQVVWVHVVLVGVLGFGAGLAVALGPVPSVVAIQTVVGYLVLGRFPLPPGPAARTGLLLAAGGAIQVVLVSTVRSRGRFAAERRATGQAYALLAELATAPDGPGTSLPAADAIEEAAAVTGRSWAGPGSTAREAFRELLVEARRLRTAVVALAGARTRLEQLGDDEAAAAVAGFQREAGGVLARVGTAVAAGADLPEVTLAVPTDRDSSRLEVDAAWWFARSRMAAIAGQLRAVARLTVPRDRHHTRGRPTPPAELRAALGVLRANLDPGSATFRHASRLAVALPVGAVLAHLLAADRGYWVPLTILVVLKPDFATTTSRGIARIAGTGAGVALASLVAATVRPHGAVVVLLVAGLSYAAYATFAANYALYAAGIGAVVVLLVGLVDPQPTTVAVDRLLDTLAGGALAFVAFLAWPAWAGRRVPTLLARLLRTNAGYLDRTLAALARPDEADPAGIRRAGDDARRARSDLETTLQRVDGEPASRRGDPAAARALLGACGRLVRTGHELAALVDPAAPPLPVLRGFARDLSTALAVLADAAGSGTVPAAFPDLRAGYDRVCAELGASGDADRTETARRAVALTAVDQLVDSTDLARDVLAHREERRTAAHCAS